VSSSEGEHDLPLAIRLDPANTSDFTASLRTFEHLRKTLHQHAPDWRVHSFIADAGHDAEPIYRYFVQQDIVPIIPLKADAPATHPNRADVNLSRRGVPTCAAGCEMAHWGSAGKDRVAFICPLKANKLDRCPLAPEHERDWHCRPELKWGPVVTVKIDDNPRLCPPLPRNSSTFTSLYNLRSGTERSNAVKKETFELEAAGHRRASFWLIRLHLIGVLQHARAWVAKEDARELVDFLLGPARPRRSLSLGRRRLWRPNNTSPASVRPPRMVDGCAARSALKLPRPVSWASDGRTRPRSCRGCDPPGPADAASPRESRRSV
jgi:hypothetical protein